jgi:signal transduction histidine kinase
MNAMLDRLATSFDHQRQLLDDAGHELRTPITIVRGHLELLDPTDPSDVSETRTLALEELDRMQRVVDDLMVLAKSQRPDFVRPQPVAVDELLVSVRDLVAPLGDRDWRIEATTDLVVLLDQQRITQALVQLVANAIRFTAAGSVVALGAVLTGSELRIWVRDVGVGIAPEDRIRIFERFGRGRGTAAAQDSPDDGAGLGLAIVAAIAEAHHGRVELDSTPGRGSTFTLCLPVATPAATNRLEDRARHRHR